MTLMAGRPAPVAAIRKRPLAAAASRVPGRSVAYPVSFAVSGGWLPGVAGGLWLCRVLVRSLFQVPSGFRMRVQPSWWMVMWWWCQQVRMQSVTLVLPPRDRGVMWWISQDEAGWVQFSGTGSACRGAGRRCGSHLRCQCCAPRPGAGWVRRAGCRPARGAGTRPARPAPIAGRRPCR